MAGVAEIDLPPPLCAFVLRDLEKSVAQVGFVGELTGNQSQASRATRLELPLPQVSVGGLFPARVGL
jgi:hypothetical protein